MLQLSRWRSPDLPYFNLGLGCAPLNMLMPTIDLNLTFLIIWECYSGAESSAVRQLVVKVASD